MKNILLLGLLLVSTLSFAKTTSYTTSIVTYKKNVIECRFGQCQATAKSTGKQCKHCVSNSGDKFCFQHK